MAIFVFILITLGWTPTCLAKRMDSRFSRDVLGPMVSAYSGERAGGV